LLEVSDASACFAYSAVKSREKAKALKKQKSFTFLFTKQTRTMLPLYVDLSGKRIVVFGGGTIAERKLRQILETNVESGEITVEVYSRDFTHWIEEMREKGEIQCFRCDLRTQNLEDLVKGAFLTLVCTDDKTLNTRVKKAPFTRSSRF